MGGAEAMNQRRDFHEPGNETSKGDFAWKIRKTCTSRYTRAS